jgi:hypothetical protein
MGGDDILRSIERRASSKNESPLELLQAGFVK